MNTFFDNIVYKGVPFDIVQPNDCPEGLENPTLRLHTYGDDSIVVNYTLSGDMVTIHIGATDLDMLDDGVIYYEWANSESAITCNNTVYTLKTPEGYDPISIEDIYESGYTSGHTAGMEDQKDLMVEADIIENGTYTRPDGYSTVNVNVGTSGSVIFEPQGIFDYRNTYYASGTPWSALTVDAQHFGDEQYTGGYNYALNNIDVESVQLSVSANGEYDAVIGPGGAGYIKKVIVDVPSSGVSTPYFGKVADFTNVGFYITDFPATYGSLLEVEFMPTINSGESWAWHEIHVGNTTASTDSYSVMYYIDTAYTGTITAEGRPLYNCYFHNTVCKFFLNPINYSYTAIGGGGYMKDSDGVFYPLTIVNPQIPSSSVYDYSTICFFLHVNSINRKRYIKSIKITDSNGVVTKLIMPRSDGKMWDVIANQESDIDWIKSDGTHPKTFNTLYEWEIV